MAKCIVTGGWTRNDEKTGRFVQQRSVWTPEQWDDGYVDNKGRFRVYRPDCPRAFASGYALRAHVVWWLYNGKCHDAELELHHRDGNRLNDELVNLEPLTRSQHQKIHRGSDVTLTCKGCGKPFTLPQWRINQGRGKYCTNQCYLVTPRSDRHRSAIGRGLRKAYAEGKR